MRRELLLLTITVSILALAVQPGCGGGAKAPASAQSDTTVQIDAVCDTTLDTTAARGAAAPDTVKPVPTEIVRSEPEKVTEKPKALPRMWDYGSEKCIPCKEMLRILTPMMTDYKDKVDVRIINVNEEKQLTTQARIQIIPTQVFYDASGKELFRHIGVYPRDSIVAKFKEFGWE